MRRRPTPRRRQSAIRRLASRLPSRPPAPKNRNRLIPDVCFTWGGSRRAGGRPFFPPRWRPRLRAPCRSDRTVDISSDTGCPRGPAVATRPNIRCRRDLSVDVRPDTGRWRNLSADIRPDIGCWCDLSADIRLDTGCWRDWSVDIRPDTGCWWDLSAVIWPDISCWRVCRPTFGLTPAVSAFVGRRSGSTPAVGPIVGRHFGPTSAVGAVVGRHSARHRLSAQLSADITA